MNKLWRLLASTLVALAFSPAFAGDLATVQVKVKSLPLERLFEGRVQAVNQSTVSAETTGRVSEIFFDVGNAVPAGEVIVKLVSIEQQQVYNQAAAALNEARVNLDVQRSEFERIEKIYQRNLVAKTVYDHALGNLNTATARVKSASAALKVASERLSYTLIRAPFSGTVLARHVEVGEAVQPGRPIMTGFDPRILRVEVDLPQSILEQVAELRTARVVIAQDESIEPVTIVLFPQADPVTGTVHMRLQLPPRDDSRLYPGRFVKVAVVVGQKDRLLVPKTSVMYRSEVTAVYVQAGDSFVLRQVRLGNTFGDNLEVISGIREGENVAIDAVTAGIEIARARAGG
jgi:membrane fusion protein, multidrug efflux system